MRTKLVLDLNTEDHIELAFNITMDGLPCRFTSVDFFDATGHARPRAAPAARLISTAPYPCAAAPGGAERHVWRARVAGTKRLNISRDIMKVRVSSSDGHILGIGPCLIMFVSLCCCGLKCRPGLAPGPLGAPESDSRATRTCSKQLLTFSRRHGRRGGVAEGCRA